MKTIRFSIKWKAVTFLSAILLCICTFMVALYTYTLLNQANERAADFNQQDNQVLEDLLSNTNLSLQQSSAIIPYLTNIRSSIQQADGVALADALKQHWQSLSLNLDVHYLHMFTETGINIGGYHTENQIDNKLMATLDAEARGVALRKQPGSILRCDAQCILFAIEPYILNDDTRGVIAIGQSIAPLVTRFKQLTGRDLAILKQSFSGSETRDLNNWGMSIWALSQFDTLSALLKLAQNETATPANTLVNSSSGRPYRIHHIKHADDESLDSQPVFLSVADITQEENDLSTAIINGIISGICGLILSEILLLWVLWKPTRRLHQLAKALPLLAVHDYSQAKQIISNADRSLLEDELDLLEQTALTVSCELEQMQAKVVTHARQLELQMSEQVRARQFMAQLLDTAPLIIITQSVNAHIITMNHWGQTLTQWSSEPDCEQQMSSFIALHTDCSICHYEMLLRMQLDTDQIIPPGEFIPVAERTGMIWQIDEWVLSEALKFLSLRNQAYPDDLLHLAINISAPTIQSPNFVNLFLRLSTIYKINPAQITIEITETAFLEDFESAQKILKTLTEHGCTIALDDFGVGFSSFNYLKQMPLSYVKLDGSYIRDITANPQEQTFARCLTEMVEGFHMKTIAKFVETPEVLQTVKALGVKCAQGYLIGRPSPYIEDPLTVAAEF